MNWFWKLLQLGSMASPEFKAQVSKDVDAWCAQTKTTRNPLDDIAAGAFKTMLMIIGVYVKAPL